MWIHCIRSKFECVSKINRRPCFRNNRFASSGKRFENHKDVSYSVSLIFIINYFRLTRSTGDTSLFNKLLICFVYTNNRNLRVIWTLIYVKYILHFSHILRACFRYTPLFNEPRFNFIFFNTSQIVLSVM